MENKIITFENYFTNSQSEDISDKYVISRSNWVKDFKEGNELVAECTERHIVSRSNWLKENKAESVIDKIPVEDLPECEQIDAEHCKVGDFLPSDLFTDMYDDKGDILGGLKDGDVLAYCCIDGATTWWTRRKDKDGDGLIRIQ